MRRRFFLFYLLLLFSCSLVAQKKFEVTIELPNNCNLNQLTVFLDDGKTQTFLKPEVKKNQLILQGLFYSEYAGILLRHPQTKRLNYQSSFFVAERPATIKLLKCDTVGSPFASYRLKNAYDFAKEKKEMNGFDSAALREAQNYLFTFGERIFSGNDSDSAIANEFVKKDQEIYKKDLEYILRNSSSYYSFWYFRRNIARSKFLPPDSLLNIFDRIFPDKYKQSMEGLTVRSFLEGRSSVKKDGIAPSFVANDINGKKISQNDFIAKKYILLTFWAPWCEPCIKEIPTLREIYQKYSAQDFDIISISYDTDYKNYLKAIKKQDMVWTNIFNDVDLINSYGGSQPIPRTYLIDKFGKIIYEGSIDDKADLQLPNLQKLLTEIFLKK
jgi:peroxiredoxin